jgi:hypothetical protein
MEQLKPIMQFVVENATLIAAFVTALTGIIAAVHQGYHRIATKQALDLTTEGIEIKESNEVKRQIEAAAPVLSRLAAAALQQSVARATQKAKEK